ncbi:hypothetical protein [Roseobacter sp. A03A-229]
MSGELITTTTAEGLKPLGSQAQRSFELIRSEVEARFGADHAAIFGEPISSTFGDQIDWYASDLGDIRALADLDEEEAEAVRARLGALVEDIRETGRALVDSAEADEQRLGEALVNAVEVPDETAVFARRSGDGWAPLIVNWARVADVQMPVRGVLKGPSHGPSPSVVPTSSPADDASLARPEEALARTAAPVAAGAAGSVAFWPWLIGLGWLLLLLISAAIIALMLRACALNLGFTPAFCPAPQTLAQTEPALAYTQVLRDRVALLERQIAIADRVCQPAFEKAEIVPPEPVTPIPAPPAPQVAQCAPGLQAIPTEELVVLLDGSGSMEIAASLPEPLSQRYYGTHEQYNALVRRGAQNSPDARRLNNMLQSLEWEVREVPGPNRMSVAQNLLETVITSAPGNMPIGMVVFPNCNAVQDLGTFQPNERGGLLQQLARQRPDGRTPLADAIRLAGGKLQAGATIDDPANMLLISDGLDSCGGDPCAEARRLHQSRPGVKISIIDMGRSVDLQCVADATGGFYVQADRLDRAALNYAMREAAGFEGRGICR